MEWFHMQMEASFGCTAFARGVSLCRLARSEPWRVPSLAAADERLEKKQKQKNAAILNGLHQRATSGGPVVSCTRRTKGRGRGEPLESG